MGDDRNRAGGPEAPRAAATGAAVGIYSTAEVGEAPMSVVDRFKLMVGVALIDGRLDEEEKPLLFRAAKELGISSADAKAHIREVAQGGKLKVDVPADPGERAKMFRSLVDLVAADGRLDAKELAFFNKLAGKFRLNELELEEILRAATE